MKCPNCKHGSIKPIANEAPATHLSTGLTTYWCPNCGTTCKTWYSTGKIRRGSINIPKGKSKPAKKKAPDRLTVGMRCRIKPSSTWYQKDGFNEALLEKRSGDSFSFLGLGQKALKKKDPKTVDGGGAWINEEELEWINSNFKANMAFMDWYQEHEDEFCGDCGAWHPKNGCYNSKTKEDYRCPNDKCPGNKHADGCCPWCDPNEKLNKKDECPKCGWTENDMF